MSLNELDPNKLLRLILVYVDQVTCRECCKYYIVPMTADCGDTLCRGCWYGRKTCAECEAPVNNKALTLNLPLQNKTEHVHTLVEKFEEIFHIKLDEYLIDTPIEKQAAKDPTKHVKDWLASSENQFTASQASQQTLQDSNNQPTEFVSNIQIHSETSKAPPIASKLHVGIPQDDWDKIEKMPDTEEMLAEKKNNVIGPMDIETFALDQFEFTSENPRRSSRKKEVKPNNTNLVTSVDKNVLKYSASEIGNRKRNWANVKRMKKEFNKINKLNKSKLNVSIEMIKKKHLEKKILSECNKNDNVITINGTNYPVLNVDDNASKIANNENQTVSSTTNLKSSNLHLEDKMKENILINQDSNHTTENMSCPVEKIFSPLQSPHDQINQDAPVSFFMKGALQTASSDENYTKNSNLQYITVNSDNAAKNDDIEITIKIGNTLTNICIQKKEKNVQLKINTDTAIQTSPDDCNLNKKDVSCSPIKEIIGSNDVDMEKENIDYITSQKNREWKKNSKNNDNRANNVKNVETIKSDSKKNTESADTVTVQYEITNSVEKELSKEMVKTATPNMETNPPDNQTEPVQQTTHDKFQNEGCINDVDLFDNDSIKDGNVQFLKSTNHTASEILMSTVKSNKSKNANDKRNRETNSDDLPVCKKMKVIQEGVNEPKRLEKNKTCSIEQDSELTNYDAILGQVFANIDADMEVLEKKTVSPKSGELHKTTKDTNLIAKLSDTVHGFSENVFSLLEKENDNTHIETIRDQSQNIDHHKDMPQKNNLNVPHSENINDIEIIEDLSTPVQHNDDSDQSIVEETPQKSASFAKQKDDPLRFENTIRNKSLKLKKADAANPENHPKTPDIMSVINLSEITDNTTRNTKHVTVMEANPRKTLETPLTIRKFVDELKHKSTPLARKSLNFDKENPEADPEQTLCSNSFLVAKTTLEREFMSKAFEDSPNTRSKSPLMTRNIKIRHNKYCLAGSCLTPAEITDVKHLCSLRGWEYVDKYTNELTHLIIGVDEDNKSQRSVKYMCALAAGKWIVSYEWVKKCLLLKKVVQEEPFEALDCTGEPGPRRSRIAKHKLFKGITFFCMPPFSILDVDTLQGMLEAAGGKVVSEAKAVRVTSSSPALLLAEPEHTQEDRFIYLAMDLGIVPVNYDWALSCLGSYTIGSVHKLLLCPSNLLPPLTAQWPEALMAREDD